MPQFMGTRVNFEGSIVVSNRNDLLEIREKEIGNRTSLFILMDVTKLVRE
jgi:hypothetical protein